MMNVRKEFQMTDTQFEKLVEACKPVPYMIFGGKAPLSQQENADIAWQYLGQELGFIWGTAKPVQGKSTKFFTAEIKTNAGGSQWD